MIFQIKCFGSLPFIAGILHMRWLGHVVHMRERRGVYRLLVRKPEGRRPLGTPRHRREDNIKMDLQEVGGGSMDCIVRLRN
jgi:hypothetical protein